jgi:hypothetical protein
MDIHSLDRRHWWTWGDVQGQKDHVMALVAKAAQRQLRLASYSRRSPADSSPDQLSFCLTSPDSLIGLRLSSSAIAPSLPADLAIAPDGTLYKQHHDSVTRSQCGNIFL